MNIVNHVGIPQDSPGDFLVYMSKVEAHLTWWHNCLFLPLHVHVGRMLAPIFGTQLPPCPPQFGENGRYFYKTLLVLVRGKFLCGHAFVVPVSVLYK